MPDNSRHRRVEYRRVTEVELARDPDSWQFLRSSKIREPAFGSDNPFTRREAFASALLEIAALENGLQGGLNAEKWPPKLEDLLLDLPHNIDAVMEALGPAIDLNTATIADEVAIQMGRLKTQGYNLYSNLDKNLKEGFRDRGVIDSDPSADNEMQLCVTVSRQAAESKEPIFWNMLYQADEASGRVDPWLFWGFRVAVSQWLDLDRAGEIRLTPALLAADTTMRFSVYEAQATARVMGEPNCICLDKQLLSAIAATEGAEPAPAGPDQDPEWLAAALQRINPNYKTEPQQSDEMPKWLRDQIQSIFGGVEVPPQRSGDLPTKEPRYGLVHFSCHFVPSKGGDLPRLLQLTLGGATILLDHDFIQEYLRIKKPSEWKAFHPGALVFLNGCTTGKFERKFRDLPSLWIEYQGARAVIATICDIPDVFAFAFTLKLYEILHKAQSEFATSLAFNPRAEPPLDLYLDSALLAARRYFMREFNNPLGLAYELFTFSGARLDAPLSAAAAAGGD